jgi:anthranilate/para-aminobenzoate synthase component II
LSKDACLDIDGDMSKADVLVLWGGTDIHPSLYGQKAHPRNQTQTKTIPIRDTVEWYLLKSAMANKKPIIGVCRGAQLMCAFAGGSLYQDVNGHTSNWHHVNTDDGKNFALPGDHHQMMDVRGTDHTLVAWADNPRSKYYESETVEFNKQYEPIIEPEIVIFKRIKGFAIQPHPEWVSQLTPTEGLLWLRSKVQDFVLS